MNGAECEQRGAMTQPRMLQDMRILITGVNSQERLSMVSLIKENGAISLQTANRNDPPHVIITRRVGTLKYFAALRQGRKLPVVIPEWLVASAAAGKRLPYSDFAAGPFRGLVICFSGLSVDEKSRLAGIVCKNGGKHSPSLSIECTHLVTVSKTSDKYVFAQKHRMACLLPKWIEDCVSAGMCLQEQGYDISDASNSSRRQRTDTSQSLLQPEHAKLDEQSTHRHQQENVSLNGSASKSLPLDPEIPKSTTRSTAGDERTGLALVSDVSQQFSGAQPLVWATADCEDSGALFLDSCVIWPVGCTDQECIEIKKLCSESGAKTFWNTPHPTLITHILVGSQLSGSDAESVSSYLSERSSSCSVPHVSVDWLRRSVGRREALPADERFRVSLHPCQRSQRQQTTVDESDLQRVSAFHGGIDNGDKSDTVCTSQKQGFMDGCYFTLAALKKSGEEGIAEQLIRAHGGRLFATKSGVPPGSRMYAICPPSLTPAQIRELRSGFVAFDMVPESNRFTVYWLECCAMAKDLLTPQRGTPCFKPLPYPLPLPGMDRVSVSVSLYEASVRTAIQKTVEIVGGRVSMEFMSARDTHLIVPLAKGEKYKACERLNIIAVTADWLVDSVTAGQLLPEAKYAPPAPPIRGDDKSQRVLEEKQTLLGTQLKDKETQLRKRPAPTSFLARQQVQGVGKRQSLRERAARLSAAAGEGKQLGTKFKSNIGQPAKVVAPLDLNSILMSKPANDDHVAFAPAAKESNWNEEPNKNLAPMREKQDEERGNDDETSKELQAALAVVSGYLASIPDARGADLDTQLSPRASDEKVQMTDDGMQMTERQSKALRRRSTRTTSGKKAEDEVQDSDVPIVEMSQYIGYSEEPAIFGTTEEFQGGPTELFVKQNNAAKERLTRASSRLRNRKSGMEGEPSFL